MRTLLTCVFLVLAALLPGQNPEAQRAHQQEFADELSKAPKEPGIRLTADVVSEFSCNEKPEVYVLSITLRARFTNVSNDSLILRKESSVVDAIVVGKTTAEIQSGKYEYVRDLSHRYIEDSQQPRPPMSSAAPPESEFVILQGGASYERRIGTWLAVRRRPGVRSTLGSGDHALQLLVETWPYYEDDAKVLRRRWRKHGRLVSLPILTEPVAFRIDPDPKLEDCSRK